ncbi:GNAT family N-acetyltransferase [Luteimonas sp. SX5]|uniref:GNAT family N-acetyltransferase n=1 Tax=Luteimonas galliterrae TaxID=2940486 RepID=A0ABT0MFL4_9GAMM|nr:GNAT family N-acetyltransferase [Luteimonas galliterrae]MCL1633657.1 GNAT family N-acetyltransferase [Luteimonas galliterrae]
MPTARICAKLADIDPAAWDDLHDGRNPFVAHAFLSGLERHGCLREEWGWTPQHLTLWQGDSLIAAAPGYLKTNSHGEFVFDHAWAHAYARYGQDYFPKYLCAVPYSPVTGPRLLARNDTARSQLLAAMAHAADGERLSSAHVNFHTEAEDSAFGEGWLPRIDVQYHWRNDAGWQDFEGFLAAMDHKHRKNIRQERAKTRRAGATFRAVHGRDASDDDLAAMYGFYLQTFAEYGNSPALTLDFLRHLARTMPDNLVLFLADHEGETIAGALCLRGGDTLYGRYWGAARALPGLHFETCYYQGIDYCLREGLRVFEPGAQGEHKIARGFLPAFVRSRHWIADPDFAQALVRWCEEEALSVRRYAATLAGHSPFRAGR